MARAGRRVYRGAAVAMADMCGRSAKRAVGVVGVDGESGFSPRVVRILARTGFVFGGFVYRCLRGRDVGLICVGVVVVGTIGFTVQATDSGGFLVTIGADIFIVAVFVFLPRSLFVSAALFV